MSVKIVCVARRKSVYVGGDELSQKFAALVDINKLPNVQNVLRDFLFDIFHGFG